jgi:hypothetical protein
MLIDFHGDIAFPCIEKSGFLSNQSYPLSPATVGQIAPDQDIESEETNCGREADE